MNPNEGPFDFSGKNNFDYKAPSRRQAESTSIHDDHDPTYTVLRIQCLQKQAIDAQALRSFTIVAIQYDAIQPH